MVQWWMIVDQARGRASRSLGTLLEKKSKRSKIKRCDCRRKCDPKTIYARLWHLLTPWLSICRAWARIPLTRSPNRNHVLEHDFERIINYPDRTAVADLAHFPLFLLSTKACDKCLPVHLTMKKLKSENQKELDQKLEDKWSDSSRFQGAEIL